MQFPQLLCTIFIVLLFACSISESQNCDDPLKTITVSLSGEANFRTIQSAIDSVPIQNSQWIHIQISPGVYNLHLYKGLIKNGVVHIQYREQVLIPMNKPCIYLEGAGSLHTHIEWNDHLNATFCTEANNTIAKGITFTNTLNHPITLDESNITQAVAAQINADKCAFFHCAFLGVQDTLWDCYGRHYYHGCYIQGGIDFIFGNGQSIFEESIINFSMGKNGPKWNGIITAQERDSPNDPSGFVFKNCNITGTTGGKALLGRSLRAYARVIIANSFLSDVVLPIGWNARTFLGHEKTITFVELGNKGPGADQTKRVRWIKHLSESELLQFLNITFIDKEGWIAKLPKSIFI
ncbi:probable pectinesterase 29 [Abrus precatorius]|uniref:pectinesterase n=1 Tax=Abrus precatorius TaxID=3816 RepID=A0A8B8LQQ7_ABRPR|nr:probable pectinesterase 29 [Abrus precatorius]